MPARASIQRPGFAWATPGADALFDRAWAHALLLEAVARLEREPGASALHYETFRAYCLGEEVTYEALAVTLGVTEEVIRGRLRAARRRLRVIVRQLLREYLGPEDDLERELASILSR